MTMLRNRFEQPPPEDVEGRIEWAGERYADLAEGKLAREEAGLLWAIVVGWADLATDDERRQYLTLARQLSELQESLIEYGE